MPNIGSELANFLAVASAAARVLVTCGLMSGFNTSHITSRSLGPRSGSAKVATGFNTQSENLPVAWFVLEPSKPHTGGFWPSATILVLLRNSRVGSDPSIQMYSA